MYQPILHKFVTGSAAILAAVSTMKIANSVETFLQNTTQHMYSLHETLDKATKSIERGMDKYAPPKK
jgi:hypothetical protein